jgi:DNA-binding CsgD family transcriptional regulator
MNKIADFTVPELNYFREMCNFTEEELEYFNLRSRNVPNVQIAMQMHVSEAKVSKLARKVKSKMFRVL